MEALHWFQNASEYTGVDGVVDFILFPHCQCLMQDALFTAAAQHCVPGLGELNSPHQVLAGSSCNQTSPSSFFNEQIFGRKGGSGKFLKTLLVSWLYVDFCFWSCGGNYAWTSETHKLVLWENVREVWVLCEKMWRREAELPQTSKLDTFLVLEF